MRLLWLLFFVALYLPKMMTAQCTTDCVWPGDLNANGIANSLDILALGIAFGEMGPARANATTDWEAQSADNWGSSLPVLGTNFKHCDADGNGIIDDQDRLVISINYNRTNSNFTGLLGSDLPGDDLFLVPQNQSARPGESLFLDVHLGTADQTISNLYGIGFELMMDTQLVEAVNVSYVDSWIGTDEEILAYDKYSDETDHLGVGISRVDGTTVDGFGKIAEVEIVITDVILGLEINPDSCVAFPLKFENVLAIDSAEQDLGIRSKRADLTVKDSTQITTSLQSEITVTQNAVDLFPNPVSEVLSIQGIATHLQEITLYNTLGQLVSHTKTSSTRQHDLPMSSLPPGVYWVEVRHSGGKQLEKILLQ